jgi:hypothetical protein
MGAAVRRATDVPVSDGPWTRMTIEAEPPRPG